MEGWEAGAFFPSRTLPRESVATERASPLELPAREGRGVLCAYLREEGLIEDRPDNRTRSRKATRKKSSRKATAPAPSLDETTSFVGLFDDDVTEVIITIATAQGTSPEEAHKQVTERFDATWQRKNITGVATLPAVEVILSFDENQASVIDLRNAGISAESLSTMLDAGLITQEQVDKAASALINF